MDHAAYCDSLPRDSLAVQLASVAIRADADHHLLLCATASHVSLDEDTEAALDRSLAELRKACIALAAVPTNTLAGYQAKASVLLVLARTSDARPPETEDDTGLAFSLFEDILGRENLVHGNTLIDEVLRNGTCLFSSRMN